MLLSSNMITIMDATDSQNLNVYLSCNLQKIQTCTIGNETTMYSPSWELTPLEITPTIFYNNTETSISNGSVSITWKRKDGAGTEAVLLTDGSETVINGKLVINKNNLANSSSGMLTYICYVTYGNITSQASVEFTLIYSEDYFVTFQIYSTNGTVLSQDINSITLQTSAYDGTNEITNATYQWSYFWEGNWVDIEGETNSSLTILKDSVTNVMSYRCIMSYKDNTYIAYESITDRTDVYYSEIRTIGGNIFRSGIDYMIAYAMLAMNGREVDPLLGPIGEVLPDAPEANDRFYLVNKETQSVVLKDYNAETGEWVDNITSHTAYQYNWGDNSGKIIYIPHNSISGSKTIQCNISNVDNEVVSNCQETILDVNDPISSTTEPQNPVDGQLWLDISGDRYVIKAYSEAIGGWQVVQAAAGTEIFTSKPNAYLQGDIWILSEEDMLDVTISEKYTAGTMLRAVNSLSTGFTIDDWTDALYYTEAINALTQYKIDNLDAYFKFDSDDGLIIGNDINQIAETRYYVQILPNQIQFCKTENDITTPYITLAENKTTIVETDFTGDISILATTTNPTPSFSLGNFKFQIESNGSLSLIKQ